MLHFTTYLQRDSNVDLWCFFIASLNKLLNKHSIGR